MTFEIEFTYNGFPYRGLVSATGDEEEKNYNVKVESDNQEFYLDIMANPCGPGKMDWCFKDPGSENTGEFADKNFLQEVGEAIEKYESANN